MSPAWYFNIALGLLLQALLFWRAYRCELWRWYPVFYGYLAYTTFWSIVLSLPLVIRLPGYPKIYWWSQLLAAALRFGVAGEIYRHIFLRDSPLRRRTGATTVAVLILLASVFWIGGIGPDSNVWLDALRKIALSVATWLAVLLGLAGYYRIQMGRNVWGMAVGLLTFTGSELIHLAAMDLLPRWWATWSYVHPIAFVFMLLVWTFALWDYYPNPESSLRNVGSVEGLVSQLHGRWAEVPDMLRRVVNHE
jgi:hypothetical protein